MLPLAQPASGVRSAGGSAWDPAGWPFPGCADAAAWGKAGVNSHLELLRVSSRSCQASRSETRRGCRAST